MEKNIKLAIVGSNYQKVVTDNLIAHCLATLQKKAVPSSNITVVRVPGSLEIPLAAKQLAKKGIYDAIIVFGAIHKGETYHFELVANQCARGCMDVSLKYGIPIIFEVLAVYTIEDALIRSTRIKENRGVEAAVTALSMISVLSKI